MTMARPRHDTFPALRLPAAFDGGRAKGEQLREILETMVRELPAGTLLPSERSIAERYRVARMTVRKEVDQLVARGLIRRAMGSGSFVAEPKVAQGTNARSFSDDMHARGLRPGAHIIEVWQRPATALLAERLRIADGDPVIDLRRLRTADGAPMAIERSQLSADRFPGLTELLAEDVSLYHLLQAHFGVRVARANHRVSVVALDRTDAALLEVAAGQPTFLIERTAYDQDGGVVEWGRSQYRGDRYDIIFEVHPGS